MDEQFETESGVKVEIGGNLLKAIKGVLKLVEQVNSRMDQNVLSPGKEVNKAFRINITKMHRDVVKNMNVVRNP